MNDTSWPQTDIDRFILAGLEAKGLLPAVDAAAATLARRLTIVLTGLPPDPAIAAAAAARRQRRGR